MIWEISECTVRSKTENATASLQIDASNYHASRVIWNFLLLHTSKVFPRLNTYNRNLTFLKARENSHDFNAEGFSKTCRFIRDHF